jgi:hypothetical protein
MKKLYFYRKYTETTPEPENTSVLGDYKPQPGDIVLEENEDYFTSMEAIKAKREEMKKELQSLVDGAHSNVLASGNKDNIEISTKMREAVRDLLKPDLQGDLEIMHLLETTPITDHRKAEIAALFAPAKDAATDALLNDVLNPHPIAAKLFGTRIKYLCMELPEYTETYSVGNESIWTREPDYPRPEFRDIPFQELAYPQVDHYASAMDEIFHMKLFRLADSFLDLNLASDQGILAFENFVHTYDISPGEYTLERVHPSPAPAHTFAELPIIKFDGWEEADVVPEGVAIPAKTQSHH